MRRLIMSRLIWIYTVCHSDIDLQRSPFWQQWMCPNAEIEESISENQHWKGFMSVFLRFLYMTQRLECSDAYAAMLIELIEFIGWPPNIDSKAVFRSARHSRTVCLRSLVFALIIRSTHLGQNVCDHSALLNASQVLLLALEIGSREQRIELAF